MTEAEEHCQTMNEHNTDPLQSIACRSRRTAAAAAQRPRREAEEAVRHHTAAVCDAMRQSGHRACRVAAEIRLSPRTLGRWRRRYRQQKSPPPRGRPAMESSLPQRREAVAWIDHEGPHIGLPTLRATFPHMPRAELRDLQADYRRYYRLTHRAPVEELRWQRPGRVWAVDHAEPLAPIDGVYAAILSVRDLASGMQLAWQPVVNQGAESAQAVLRRLFVVHGPPLVLKSDNGSAFKDAGTQAVLSTEKIVWLPSPPRTPKYNGGCEAGNGSMKMRTRFFVHRNGRLHHWAAADLEAARRQANDLARPSGHLAPTPAQRWAGVGARWPLGGSFCDHG